MRLLAQTVLLLLLLVTSGNPAAGQTPDRLTKRQQKQAEKAQRAELVAAVAAEAEAVLVELRTNDDFKAARTRIDEVFDRAIGYLPKTEEKILRDLAFARRLIHRLAEAKKRPTRELLNYLLDNPDFARALIFSMDLRRDRLERLLDKTERAGVFGVADTLRKQRGQHLNDFATLAAAICLVHDRTKPMRVNENSATSPDPVAIFDFYVRNEDRMFFGIRDMPTELLVYIVDVKASIGELEWALGRYAGDTNVGARFFDIKYDYDHLTKGQTKKSTAAGWNLRSILKNGGVCADQAYFAVTVGKAIGVPAVYTVGRSARSSHAWVGFLRADKRNAWWDFNSGRYEDYQNARGNVRNPQTNQLDPDSTISLLAAHLRSPLAAREYVAAMTDAATRLAKARTGEPLSTAPFVDSATEPLRTATLDAALELLQAGLSESPGYLRGWLLMESLCDADDFTASQLREWGTFLHKLCGRQYQDFYLQIVHGMIDSVDDPREQDRLWNAAFKSFSNRPDLAAKVRLTQGRMWLKHEESERAGRCFEDVIIRYANDGPHVVEALGYASRILRKQGDGQRLLALHLKTWNQTRRPKDKWAKQFAMQSNWYRIGSMYAAVLTEAGNSTEAKRVRAELAKTVK